MRESMSRPKKDMLTRFKEMWTNAGERGIKINRNQLATLVLADVIEDQGIKLTRGLDEIDKSLVAITGNVGR